MKITHLLQKLSFTTRSTKLGLTAIVLLVATTLTISAGQKVSTLYAATGTFGVQGVLYTINAKTGAVIATIGPLNDSAGNNYAMAGMRYNPINGILYGVTSDSSAFDPSYLITINPATALVTPIGPLGVVLTDVAIDPRSGIMYGVSGFNQKFYTVNLTTGLATQAGSTGLGFQNGGGLASTAKGILFGVDNFSTYSYNKTTGKATLVGLTLLPDLVRAMDVNSSGVFYGVEGGGGIDNLHLRFLVTINITTGLGLEVAAIGVDDLDAMAFVPLTTE